MPEDLLPLPPQLTKAAEARAGRRIPRDATADLDRTPLRWFHRVAKTVRPEASVTGIGVLKKLVNRIANGDLPDSSCTTLIQVQVQRKAGKMRPIAVRKAPLASTRLGAMVCMWDTVSGQRDLWIVALMHALMSCATWCDERKSRDMDGGALQILYSTVGQE